MNKQNVSERGQVLIILALAIIGLFAMTGLAIDGSMVLADRRQAQNAADTAVMAGALAKVKPQTDTHGDVIPWTSVTLDRASSNGYAGDLIRSQVEIYSCDDTDASCPAPYAGDSDYIQVIITSHVDTSFASIIGFRELTNKVQAVAMSRPATSPANGNGIVVLNPSSHQAIKTTGKGPITVHGGGIYVNSNASSDALSITNDGAITVDSDQSISIVGGYKAKPELISPTPVTGVSPILDPLASLPVPANPGGSCPSINYSQNPALTLNPGCYKGIKNSGKGKIILNPGLYYLDSGDFSNSGAGTIIGNQVTIYVKTGSVSLTGQGDFNITSPTSGTCAGIAIFVDRDNSKNVSVTGNGSSYLQGTIYAAGSLVTVTGNGDSTILDSQIVADKVATTGQGAIVLNYDGSGAVSPPRIMLIK